MYQKIIAEIALEKYTKILKLLVQN